MTTIQVNESTGAFVLFGNPGCPPTPREGYTIHQVESIPPGPGKLLWQNGALVRVVPPVPVPAVISPAQLREWLIRAGKLDAVTAALAAILDPIERQVMQSWFEFTTEVRRDNAKVLALAQALGMTDEQIDGAFRSAAVL